LIDEPLVVVFFPEGAFGPTNNCLGIADVLRRRGHRVFFVLEESFAGTMVERGFEERLMRLTPAPEIPEVPGQFWKDFVRETAPAFRRSTTEQLAGFIAPTMRALVDGARYVDDRLAEIVEELRPDMVVEDNVVTFPALPASGRPWARIASCNPAELKDLVNSVGPLAQAGTVAEAIAFAEVVLLAVPYRALPQIGKDHGAALAAKALVIDTCNPFASRDGEIAVWARAKGAGLATAELLPGARLVRAFNAIGAGRLPELARRKSDRVGMPIAGDDAKAIALASGLIREIGFEPVLIGPLAMGRHLVPGTPLAGEHTREEIRTLAATLN